MLDFAHGYTTLANGGDEIEPYFIEKVEDLEGNILYEHKEKHNIVLNSNYVYILNEMMTNTTNKSFSSYTTPTALSLSDRMTRKYALKTGTTNTDSWSVGYTPDLMMMVWTGNDEAHEIDAKASYYSKNIWLDTMEKVLKTDNWYEKPQNVIGMVKNGVTGEENSKENSTIFYYVKGSEIETVSKEEKNND